MRSRLSETLARICSKRSTVSASCVPTSGSDRPKTASSSRSSSSRSNESKPSRNASRFSRRSKPLSSAVMSGPLSVLLPVTSPRSPMERTMSGFSGSGMDEGNLIGSVASAAPVSVTAVAASASSNRCRLSASSARLSS